MLEAGGDPGEFPDIDIPIFADHVVDTEYDWQYKTVPQRSACKGHVDNVSILGSSMERRQNSLPLLGRRQNLSVGNCKILQTFANIGNNRPIHPIPGLPTFSQQWQKSPFSRCSSNDILITLTAHKMGHVG